MPRIPKLRIGSRVGSNLTIIDVIDKKTGRHPVYIAWSHKDWCPVACKVYESMRRAEREGKALGAFKHPNIVRVFGAVEPGLLVTEFLYGPTLHRVIRDSHNHRMDVSQAMRVAIHIGAALQHMHRRGGLHLDVKPTNVIVTAGRPVLFDLEAVRQIGGPRPPDVMGTGPYIAPEECELKDVTPAADVFSLCATIYQMITGHLPFALKRAGRPYPQTYRTPTPPIALRASLDPLLSELVMSGLAREPDDRPTLALLLPALNAFIVDGEPMWPPMLKVDAPARKRTRQTANKAAPAEPPPQVEAA